MKTPAQLLEIYYKSVGRGSCLNLNLPPDRRGMIHENDIQSLQEFRRHPGCHLCGQPGRESPVHVQHTGESSAVFSQTDSGWKPQTYWSTDDPVTKPELVLEMDAPATFNVVSLREFSAAGTTHRAICRGSLAEWGMAGICQGDQHRQPSPPAMQQGHHQESAFADCQSPSLPSIGGIRLVPGARVVEGGTYYENRGRGRTASCLARSRCLTPRFVTKQKAAEPPVSGNLADLGYKPKLGNGPIFSLFFIASF